MQISKEEVISVLTQYNPWWRNEPIADLPSWRRAIHQEFVQCLVKPTIHRAILLAGARQVGKTTLILQAINDLIQKHQIHPANILYITFDHPLLKMADIDLILSAWREREPKQNGKEFIFIDEAHYMKDWGTWVKHQVDFAKYRQIVFTGSAIPILESSQESGVGRWQTIRLSTLSFYEYLQLKQIKLPELPQLRSLREIFEWPKADLYEIAEIATAYIAHFHDYLIRGGFPQSTLIESITQVQRLLREDIIDKILRRDMTTLFGVRRTLELEQAFLYLCMHDDGILDMPTLCSNLEVTRPTAQQFIDLLEATYLIYRLPPFGYGKEVLRGRYKVYLADPAISPAILLKGRSTLDDPKALGIAAETAVFKHLFTRFYPQNVRFSYWKNAKNWEVDVVAEVAGKIIPFEVKYRSSINPKQDLQGIMAMCEEKKLDRGYVITKSPQDLGNYDNRSLMRIPAALFCYWMGEAEHNNLND